MPYLHKFTIATLLTICSISATTAMESTPDNLTPQGAVKKLQNAYGDIDNPDEIYNDVLENGDPRKTAWIIDVDGTITQAADPSRLRGQLPLARGNSVDLIKKLIDRGALVIFASAWVPFKDTIERLKKIGFEDYLGNEAGETISEPFASVEDINFKFTIQYCCYGRVISAKLLPSISSLDDGYFRNKALTLKLIPKEQRKHITDIYFLDDCLKNHRVFLRDVNFFKLYQKKNLYRYYVTSPKPQSAQSSSTTMMLPEREETKKT